MARRQKGQSTLEYIILVTAVVVVVLGYLGTTDGGFQGTLEDTLNNATNKMPEMLDKWKDMKIPGADEN